MIRLIGVVLVVMSDPSQKSWLGSDMTRMMMLMIMMMMIMMTMMMMMMMMMMMIN